MLCGTSSDPVSATLSFFGLCSLLPPRFLGLLLVPVLAARASSARAPRSPQPPAVAAAATGAGAGSSRPKREGKWLTGLTRHGLGLSRGGRSFGSGRACGPPPSRTQSIAPPAQMQYLAGVAPPRAQRGTRRGSHQVPGLGRFSQRSP